MTAVPPIAAASAASPIPAPFRQNRPLPDMRTSRQQTVASGEAGITGPEGSDRCCLIWKKLTVLRLEYLLLPCVRTKTLELGSQTRHTKLQSIELLFR